MQKERGTQESRGGGGVRESNIQLKKEVKKPVSRAQIDLMYFNYPPFAGLMLTLFNEHNTRYSHYLYPGHLKLNVFATGMRSTISQTYADTRLNPHPGLQYIQYFRFRCCCGQRQVEHSYLNTTYQPIRSYFYKFFFSFFFLSTKGSEHQFRNQTSW